MWILKIGVDFVLILFATQELPDKSFDLIGLYATLVVGVNGIKQITVHLVELVVVDEDVRQVLNGSLEIDLHVQVFLLLVLRLLTAHRNNLT